MFAFQEYLSSSKTSLHSSFIIVCYFYLKPLLIHEYPCKPIHLTNILTKTTWRYDGALPLMTSCSWNMHILTCPCLLTLHTFVHVFACSHPLMLVFIMPGLSIEDSFLFQHVFHTWNKHNGYCDVWQCTPHSMASFSMQWLKWNTYFSI
jgi:hypothetical protein